MICYIGESTFCTIALWFTCVCIVGIFCCWKVDAWYWWLKIVSHLFSHWV